MPGFKQELIGLLNRALELEHAARVQYLAHAELIKGIEAEPVIARLKEIASDEAKHQEIFRTLIGDYLGAEPSMGFAQTHSAQDTKKILETNLHDEKFAIDFYKQMHQKLIDNKGDFQYEFETLEHQIRHVISEEEEHVAELNILLGT